MSDTKSFALVFIVRVSKEEIERYSSEFGPNIYEQFATAFNARDESFIDCVLNSEFEATNGIFLVLTLTVKECIQARHLVEAYKSELFLGVTPPIIKDGVSVIVACEEIIEEVHVEVRLIEHPTEEAAEETQEPLHSVPVLPDNSV